MNVFGVPGIGGSLGTCCYCGKSFCTEVLMSRSCHMLKLGGVAMAAHVDCLPKLQGLCVDGGISFERWRELPEGSPLIAEMQRLEQEPTQ